MPQRNAPALTQRFEGPTPPAIPLSRADRAAHESASHVRPWLSPAGEEALRRASAATDRIRREEYDEALRQRGLAEYEQWARSAA